MDMLALKTIGLIWAAMLATAFWESSVEGEDAWNKGKLGWKLRFKKRVIFTSYHFWLFIIMYPVLLCIPLMMNFSVEFLGIIISGYFSGLVIEDYFWFIANPRFTLKNFNPKDVKWHLWFKVGKFYIPYGYVVGIIIAIASWFFLWR